jgi:hypothetical protein
MKLTFLKFKKNSLPPLTSLRPKIFNIDLFWFASLGLCFVILVITALIGFNFFYSQYFETYKQSGPAENFQNIINIDQLKNTIQKRNNFINASSTLPRDPSL